MIWTLRNREAFAMMQTAKSMHSIAQVLVQCGFKVNKALLGIDALLNLRALHSHPASFSQPFQRFLASTSISLFI